MVTKEPAERDVEDLQVVGGSAVGLKGFGILPLVVAMRCLDKVWTDGGRCWKPWLDCKAAKRATIVVVRQGVAFVVVLPILLVDEMKALSLARIVLLSRKISSLLDCCKNKE